VAKDPLANGGRDPRWDLASLQGPQEPSEAPRLTERVSDPPIASSVVWIWVLLEERQEERLHGIPTCAEVDPARHVVAESLAQCSRERHGDPLMEVGVAQLVRQDPTKLKRTEVREDHDSSDSVQPLGVDSDLGMPQRAPPRHPRKPASIKDLQRNVEVKAEPKLSQLQEGVL